MMWVDQSNTRKKETEMKYFKFNGDELTRGDFGVRVTGSHTTEEDPDGVYVFDPDVGDEFYCTVEQAQAVGFEEITEEEWKNL